jgi:predicted Rdx family selenoprotein
MVGLELRTGTKGVFKVTLDDEVVYDKALTGRRPHAGELRELVKSRLGQPLTWRKSHTPS